MENGQEIGIQESQQRVKSGDSRNSVITMLQDSARIGGSTTKSLQRLQLQQWSFKKWCYHYDSRES